MVGLYFHEKKVAIQQCHCFLEVSPLLVGAIGLHGHLNGFMWH